MGTNHSYYRWLTQSTSIAPLVTFRVLFGAIMAISMVRFISKGWVSEMYVDPLYYFTYTGFEWVQPLGEWGMYSLFALLTLSAIAIMLGFYYRWAATAFFLGFTYVELIDKTNYLNHYYFVSILAFLLILLPAHRLFSLDVWQQRVQPLQFVPRWTVTTIQLQLGLVYFFAGLAKLNPDWMLHAMPLAIWLPAHADFPLIGGLFALPETAYVFSWFGALYDLSIPFLLLWGRTRVLAYFMVVAFHVMTALLFPIGMFPYIMLLATLIFFSPQWHQSVLQKAARFFKQNPFAGTATSGSHVSLWTQRIILPLLALHFIIQLLLPLRFLAYEGPLFWTEQGYRFSWRVMLMEKAGYVTFHITDPKTQRSGEATVSDYLTPNQEKMMATQPDMIWQFAQFLETEYQRQGIADAEVRAEAYVTLNGSGSRPFTDPAVDLTKEAQLASNYSWILPFEL